METLKIKIMNKFKLRTPKTFEISKLKFRVPKKCRSGLPYLEKGWVKYFKNHISRIFRVQKLIPRIINPEGWPVSRKLRHARLGPTHHHHHHHHHHRHFKMLNISALL